MLNPLGAPQRHGLVTRERARSWCSPRGRPGGARAGRAVYRAGGEGVGEVGGAHGGEIVLGLDQIGIGGLNGTAIPDDLRLKFVADS